MIRNKKARARKRELVLAYVHALEEFRKDKGDETIELLSYPTHVVIAPAGNDSLPYRRSWRQMRDRKVQS